MLSLIKELVDDLQRYFKDLESNQTSYKVLKQKKGFVEVKSQNLKMGDLILIESNQRVPADLVVVCTD